MKAFKGLHFLALAIACIAAGFLVPSGFSACFYIASMVFGYQSIRRANLEANIRAIALALPSVDQLFLGKRYVGLQSKLVHTTQLGATSTPGHLGFRQLCRTDRGAWFIIEFDTRSGSGRSINTRIVDVIDDAVAKEWLLRENATAYKDVFGALPDYQVA